MRVFQVANVKSEWNLIKTFPDLSGTGTYIFPEEEYKSALAEEEKTALSHAFGT
ncbi:unnamed protein product [Rhodiola kirilowii]